MASTMLSIRNSNLSTFNAVAINYSTLSGTTTILTSTMVSIGVGNNKTYSTLSQGNFTSTSNWVTSLSGRASTIGVSMSANAQTQLVVSQVSTATSVQYTSTLGAQWSSISGSSGLPNSLQTSYSAGAISGDGMYGVLGTTTGELFVTSNAGQTFSGLNTASPAIYLPLDTVPANGSSSSGTAPTTLTVVGPPTQAPSFVIGSGAINLANTPGSGNATQYIRGSWTVPANFAVRLWFNMQSPPTSNIEFLFSTGTVANGNDTILYIDTARRLVLKIPGGVTIYSSLIVTVNTWYNVFFTIQSNGACSLYANNIVVGTGTSTATALSTGNFGIGTYDAGGASLINSFAGYIDDIKIYNTAIPFTNQFPSQSFTNVAVSNSGQYMLATMANQGLYLSSNYGATFILVTGAMLSALWTSVQVSATGQYLLANSQTTLVQPNTTGLIGSTTVVNASTTWQVNGITWTSSASSAYDATNNSFNVFTNPEGLWICTAGLYNGDGTYNGSKSTNVIGQGTVTGEYVQLQSSIPLPVHSYTIASGDYRQYPSTLTFAGSNDGVTWYLLQSVTMSNNPAGTAGGSTSTSYIIINQSGAQTMTTNITTATFTCITSQYSANSYTYIRMIMPTVFGGLGIVVVVDLFLRFQAGGQTYSINYGASWNNTYNITSTAVALSPSGQTSLSVNAPQLIADLNFEGTFADLTGLAILNYVALVGSLCTFNSSIYKVGINSLSVTNTAGSSSTSYLNYSLSSRFNPSLFTISTWIYPTALPSSGASVPFSFSNGSTSAGTYFYIPPTTGTFTLNYSTTTSPSGTVIVSSVSVPVSNTSWYHIGIVVANQTISIYINSVFQSVTNYTGTLSLQNGGAMTNLYIGAAVPAYGGYAGYVDSFRIYNTALTAAQINTIYTTPSTTDVSGQVAVSPQKTGLTSTTWNQSGVNWIASASTSLAGPFYPYNMFDNNNGIDNRWVPSSETYYTTGNNSGIFTTILGGIGSIQGDWIQLQSSVPLIITSYQFGNGFLNNRLPKIYYIIGSDNGTDWYPIQSGLGGTVPIIAQYTLIPSVIIVNNASTQSFGTGSITTTIYSGTTIAYRYFRLLCVANYSPGGYIDIGDWVVNFTGPANTSLYNIVPSLQGFSTGTYTAGTIPGTITGSAVSYTGQYMVVVTNNTSGNNVYYSTNTGATFVGISVGVLPLTSCAISYDGSYITVSNATTVYQLNNNSSGYTVAIGNQAGAVNQYQNAIAIGNYAGNYYQYSNSIILNATGSPLNSANQGFYVAPIASIASYATPSYLSSIQLLGYGPDNQIVQTGITSLYGANGNVGIGLTNPGAPLHIYSTTASNMLAITNATAGNSTFISFLANNAAYGYIGLDNSLGVGLLGSNVGYGFDIGTPTTTPLSFFTNNLPRMRIDSSGNVGIGITTPSATAKLHVVGNIFNDYTSFVRGQNGLPMETSATVVIGANTSGTLLYPTKGGTIFIWFISGEGDNSVSAWGFYGLSGITTIYKGGYINSVTVGGSGLVVNTGPLPRGWSFIAYYIPLF